MPEPVKQLSVSDVQRIFLRNFHKLMIIYFAFVEEAHIILAGQLYLVTLRRFENPCHERIFETLEFVIQLQCFLNLVDLRVPSDGAGVLKFIHYSYKPMPIKTINKSSSSNNTVLLVMTGGLSFLLGDSDVGLLLGYFVPSELLPHGLEFGVILQIFIILRPLQLILILGLFQHILPIFLLHVCLHHLDILVGIIQHVDSLNVDPLELHLSQFIINQPQSQVSIFNKSSEILLGFQESDELFFVACLLVSGHLLFYLFVQDCYISIFAIDNVVDSIPSCFQLHFHYVDVFDLRFHYFRSRRFLCHCPVVHAHPHFYTINILV